ncbi:MAG TPA: OmpA family protein [Clostridia bacterium]|nr:OmpA family protein [Clostridia bacterium]
MRKRRSQGELPGSPHWMTTFSDMMTLILVFFVLLFSLSVVDTIKFQAFLASFQGVGVLDWGEKPMEEVQPETITPIQDLSSGRDPLPPAPDYTLMEVYEMVQQTLAEAGLDDQVGLRYEEAGVALDIPDKVLFDTAKADLKPEAQAVLDPLADLFRRLPFQVHVEGHTDSRPISTREFPSNWELSGARASRVIRYYIDTHHLDPHKFVAIGYGEYRPVAPNDTEENMQLNRRVVMVIRANEVIQREVLAVE